MLTGMNSRLPDCGSLLQSKYRCQLLQFRPAPTTWRIRIDSCGTVLRHHVQPGSPPPAIAKLAGTGESRTSSSPFAHDVTQPCISGYERRPEGSGRRVERKMTTETENRDHPLVPFTKLSNFASPSKGTLKLACQPCSCSDREKRVYNRCRSRGPRQVTEAELA